MGFHKVHPGEVFVGREDSVKILSGDLHETRKSCPAPYKEALESLFLQVVEGGGAPHDEVGDKFHPHFPEVFEFEVDDGIGKPEFWNTIFEDSANFVKSFEHGYVVAILGHIAGKGEGCWAGAHGCHPDTVGRKCFRNIAASRFPFEVSCKSFKVTNGHGGLF